MNCYWNTKKYTFKHNTVYCEVFYTVHSLTAIIYLIFQKSAHYNIEHIHLLSKLSSMFRSLLHHTQEERHFTWSKLIAITTRSTLFAVNTTEWIIIRRWTIKQVFWIRQVRQKREYPWFVFRKLVTVLWALIYSNVIDNGTSMEQDGLLKMLLTKYFLKSDLANLSLVHF